MFDTPSLLDRGEWESVVSSESLQNGGSNERSLLWESDDVPQQPISPQPDTLTKYQFIMLSVL